jgi:DNA-directed RNA polymerase subunit K/omega
MERDGSYPPKADLLMVEKEEVMELDFTEKLEKISKNRYEAVLMVAKQARRLNLERMKAESQALQMGEEEAASEKKEEKVTNQAIRDVLEGKVEFERPEEKPKSTLKRF